VRAVEDPGLALEDPVDRRPAGRDASVADGEGGDLGLGPRAQQACQLGVGARPQHRVADDDHRAEADREREHRGQQQADAECHRRR
jgi:hypothetical protein